MDGKQAVEFAVIVTVLIFVGWSVRPRGMKGRETWHNSFYGSVDADSGSNSHSAAGHHDCSHDSSSSDGGSCGGGDSGGGD